MSKSGDRIERCEDGIRIFLDNEVPFGVITLRTDEVQMFLKHQSRCHNCTHLEVFHPIKGGFCVVGICRCTYENFL